MNSFYPIFTPEERPNWFECVVHLGYDEGRNPIRLRYQKARRNNGTFYWKNIIENKNDEKRT